MLIVDAGSAVRVDEIAEDIYRISTPISPDAFHPQGFSYNQFLIVDDEPLLHHTGKAGMVSLVRRAIEAVIPIARLRWLSFGHVEADECGAFPAIVSAAPHARHLCGEMQAVLAEVNELTDRPPEVLSDGKSRTLGKHRVSWIDAPRVPHAWDNGFVFESTTRTLFVGDLFAQAGAHNPPVTERDILGPSEVLRRRVDYFSHAPGTRKVIERLAGIRPELLACMHGSAFRGNCGALLQGLAETVG
jgi:flavorubredoxin